MKQEYNRAMDKVRLSDEASQRIGRMLEERQAQQRSSPGGGKRWTVVLAVAAAALLMMGTVFAAVYRAGVLDTFFRGDTSALEPYVETEFNCVENGDYRLTVDSSLFDGVVLYATATVEGLNQQAVEQLMSGQVIEEYMQSKWGPERGRKLIEQGSEGPDLFRVRLEPGNHVSGLAVDSLPNGSENSKSWIIQMILTGLEHPQTEPVMLSANFMEGGGSVLIPVEQMPEVVRIPVEQAVLEDPSGGEPLYVDYIELSPIRFTYVGRYFDAVGYTLPVTFRMKDGRVLTCEELGLELAMCDVPGPADVLGRQLAEVVYISQSMIDLEQVESVILGAAEFPLEGN